MIKKDFKYNIDDSIKDENRNMTIKGTFYKNKKQFNKEYNKYYTLNDLGINENELLANVSVLSSNTWDSSFNGSNVTSLPKLKKIVGYYDWGDCNIKDFSFNSRTFR